MPARAAILASGVGTNVRALLNCDLRPEVEIIAAASNRPQAPALQIAAHCGLPTATFKLDDYTDRTDRDNALADWLLSHNIDLIVLAGYMAILTPEFVARFRNRIVNVHPSLLPAFPGTDAIAAALAYGARVTGVTVHLVDEGVDTGPILLQEAIAIDPARETKDDVHRRLRPIEHRLLPAAVRLVAAAPADSNRPT